MLLESANNPYVLQAKLLNSGVHLTAIVSQAPAGATPTNGCYAGLSDAWWAGLMDAEGYLAIDGRGRLRLTFESTCRPAVEAFRDRFTPHTSVMSSQRYLWKTAWNAVVNGANALRAVEVLEPFMVTKKAQFQLVLGHTGKLIELYQPLQDLKKLATYDLIPEYYDAAERLFPILPDATYSGMFEGDGSITSSAERNRWIAIQYTQKILTPRLLFAMKFGGNPNLGGLHWRIFTGREDALKTLLIHGLPDKGHQAIEALAGGSHEAISRLKRREYPRNGGMIYNPAP